jgi:hypothetical protein
MKKAQVSVAAVILVVLIMVIVAVIVGMLIIRYNLFSGYAVIQPSSQNQQKTTEIEEVTSTSNEIICPSPYMRIQDSCCLDENYNKICDSDEEKIKETEMTCEYPYMKKGTTCCADYDRNRICDDEENYGDRTSTRRAVDVSGSLDSPFDITDLEIYRDEISIEVKNEGDEDVIIKNFDVEDCDNENFNKQIDSGDRKTFNLDCDFGTGRITSDIEVEYTTVGGNETLTAEGRIKGDFSRYTTSSYCDSRYEDC